MPQTVKRTDEEIEKLEQWCFEAEDNGPHYASMTYEQGIRDAIDWLFHDGENPNEEA